ncbi:Hypothetical_protein [Hexamita inflata]|uniref:Hypothetical_protein n=1 Tax=Hexamita inflata TaxID=28002 RepID=A0AA86R876_9EUKA|nr:Hypothetical protein HINF_LOCUS55464 [Hexamita inflata]
MLLAKNTKLPSCSQNGCNWCIWCKNLNWCKMIQKRYKSTFPKLQICQRSEQLLTSLFDLIWFRLKFLFKLQNDTNYEHFRKRDRPVTHIFKKDQQLLCEYEIDEIEANIKLTFTAPQYTINNNRYSILNEGRGSLDFVRIYIMNKYNYSQSFLHYLPLFLFLEPLIILDGVVILNKYFLLIIFIVSHNLVNSSSSQSFGFNSVFIYVIISSRFLLQNVFGLIGIINCEL